MRFLTALVIAFTIKIFPIAAMAQQYLVEVPSGSWLVLRSAPTDDSLELQRMPRGLVVTELERRAGWSYLRVPSGNQGWAPSRSLAALEPERGGSGGGAGERRRRDEQAPRDEEIRRDEDLRRDEEVRRQERRQLEERLRREAQLRREEQRRIQEQRRRQGRLRRQQQLEREESRRRFNDIMRRVEELRGY